MQRSFSNVKDASGNNNNALWAFQIGPNRFDSGEGDQPPEEDPRFLSNSIRTAKYSLLSFLPKNFWHQLKKGPNLYYIFICLLQMIKPISITGGSPTNAPPLLFLMVVSMIKDFYEDSRRRKADLEENNRKILRVISQTNKPDTSNI